MHTHAYIESLIDQELYLTKQTYCGVCDPTLHQKYVVCG